MPFTSKLSHKIANVEKIIYLLLDLFSQRCYTGISIKRTLVYLDRNRYTLAPYLPHTVFWKTNSGKIKIINGFSNSFNGKTGVS